MTYMSTTTYTLANGVQMHEEKPDRFYVPSDEVKQNLLVGDKVRLIFNHEEIDLPSETMWVVISKADHPKFEGWLDDNSLFKTEMTKGFVVDFEADNIVYVVKVR
jgi:hypothetical protein